MKMTYLNFLGIMAFMGHMPESSMSLGGRMAARLAVSKGELNRYVFWGKVIFCYPDSCSDLVYKPIYKASGLV